MKVAPGGGPKDTTPAVVTSVDPVTGTTSLKERSITFEFDDYVDRSIRNAITVLPNARFSTSYGGDELEVTFEEPLDTNTTYTVTIGTEWTDLRGNKPTESFTTVFSTGERIDTGSIEGIVNGASLANVVLFCYQRADTLPESFSPRTTVPKFRLPVGSSGMFILKGLPDGLYRVIAVRDENRNGLLDNSEDFVVSPSDVRITNGVAPQVVLLIGRAIDRDPPVIARARSVTQQLITLEFSETVVPVVGWHNAISLTDNSGGSVSIAAMWLEKKPGDKLFV
ncbi:MAG: Ig-like domain-containing protein, partial [Candidatus Kapabacteria bacterium]|nr:Ig-like domain-containing protein [Candidatus Kapabacteria bacterium]